jgi:hypothetical protein
LARNNPCPWMTWRMASSLLRRPRHRGRCLHTSVNCLRAQTLIETCGRDAASTADRGAKPGAAFFEAKNSRRDLLASERPGALRLWGIKRAGTPARSPTIALGRTCGDVTR